MFFNTLRQTQVVTLEIYRTFLTSPFWLFTLATIFCSFSPEPVLAESVDSSIQAGITDYRQQNFEQAEINFSKAQKEQPDNPELNYNLANSHYKNGKYQEALQSYIHATTNKTSPDLKQNALYNSGNALYRLGKLEESIQAYKKVLETNPGDMDAKFNLEFVREKLKEKKQKDEKQNQPQDKDSEGDQDQNENPSSDNDRQDEGKKTGQRENQEPSPPEEPEQTADPSEKTESNPSELAQNQESSISKDQAEQWLSGLDEELKKFSQKQANREKGKTSDSDKDW